MSMVIIYIRREREMLGQRVAIYLQPYQRFCYRFVSVGGFLHVNS